MRHFGQVARSPPLDKHRHPRGREAMPGLVRRSACNTRSGALSVLSSGYWETTLLIQSRIARGMRSGQLGWNRSLDEHRCPLPTSVLPGFAPVLPQLTHDEGGVEW